MNSFEFLHKVVRWRRQILGIVLGAMVVATIITLLMPNYYVSRASILPTGGAEPLDKVKELVDLQIPSDRDDNSSELYPVILTSYSIGESILDQDYVFTHDGEVDTVQLPQYFGTTNRDDLHRHLSGMLTVSTVKQTGVIKLAVRSKYPALSQVVLQEYLNQLEYFNLHRRTSQAKQYTEYLSRELETARKELAAAEDRLSAFQSANRNWASTTDPELKKELARLDRDVAIEGATFSFLRREVEMARLDMQKDMPIIRILDPPTTPIRKSSPARTIIVLSVGALVGFVTIGAMFIVAIARQRTLTTDRASYADLRNTMDEQFPRTLRLIRRFGMDMPPSVRTDDSVISEEANRQS